MRMAREVTLVDAGLGSVSSVERALIQVGGAVRVTEDPDEVARSRMVVFPGQNAFGAATKAVVDGAMGAALKMVIERGDPFLGICMGMQLLFDGSDENGGQEGLHVLSGQCRRFPAGLVAEGGPDAGNATASDEKNDMSTDSSASETSKPEPLMRRLKVPHMGWNEVEPTGDHYYFVHSYYAEATRAEDIMWISTYGGLRFPAAVRRENVLGCQFHPEKSQRAGLKFLRAFILGGWG